MTVERSGLCPTLRSQAHGNLPVVAGKVYACAVSAGLNDGVDGPPSSGCHQGEGVQSGGDGVLCMATGQGHGEIRRDLAPTLNCTNEQPYLTRPRAGRKHTGYILRRLMPLECERLQGFPDDWTAKGHDRETICDTKRYQMLGNSIAVPCAAYIMQGISRALGGSGEPSLPVMPGYVRETAAEEN